MKPAFHAAHAETVILERRLEKHWIGNTVHPPAWTVPDPAGGGAERRFLKVEKRGERCLRVLSVEDTDKIRIISALLDRDAKKPQ